MSSNQLAGDWWEQLCQLVVEACSYPPRSAAQRKCLTKLIRFMATQPWQDNNLNDQTLWNQQWFDCCYTLCKTLANGHYSLEREQIIPWLSSFVQNHLDNVQKYPAA